MKLYHLPIFAAAMALASACGSNGNEKEDVALTKSGLNPENFVDTIDDVPVALYTLANENGMEVCITNFGGRVVSIMVPDKDGNFQDVVLGFDNVQAYADREHNPSDFGAAIGRYANRIKDGKFSIDGTEYQLERNNVLNPNATGRDDRFLHHLHGGFTGWQYKPYEVLQADSNHLVLQMASPEGDGKFPGNVVATVTYTLTDDNALDIQYEGTTDAPTVLNMTNHSYFNLNGNPEIDVTDCTLQLMAENFTPVDSTFIPTGEIASVKDNDPFNFLEPKVIAQEINSDHQQIVYGGGYDHNWVLDNPGDDATPAAIVTSPVTGITLTVYTNEPGIQVYSGNFLDGSAKGTKGGKAYNHRAGLCLETQHFPDSPNHDNFPSTVLKPGEIYNSHCVYKFGIADAE